MKQNAEKLEAHLKTKEIAAGSQSSVHDAGASQTRHPN
jgi:hypothetical protein